MIALNFASDDEANSFYRVAINQVSNRTKRRLNQQHQNGNGHMECDSGIQLRNEPKAFIPQPSTADMNGRNRKKPTRKLTTADISMPTNFQHIAHIGWDGKNLNNEEVNNLSRFLEKAGVSESQMNNRKTRQMIYDFIDTYKVLDSVKSEEQHNKPTVNSNRTATLQRSAPPPPPSAPPIKRLPPQMNNNNNIKANAPVRPMPIQSNTTATVVNSAIPIPPPPPPPMMPMAMNSAPNVNISHNSNRSLPAPVVDDGRNALLDAIRKGTTLKKVDSMAQKDDNDNENKRNDLMSEIRQGKELRSANERDSPPSAGGTDALADALRRALQERSKVMCSSDEEGDSSDNNDEWED